MCIFCVAIATIFGIYLVMHWVLCNMIFCVSTSACEKARARQQALLARQDEMDRLQQKISLLEAAQKLTPVYDRALQALRRQQAAAGETEATAAKWQAALSEVASHTAAAAEKNTSLLQEEAARAREELARMTAEQWDTVLDINLRGAFLVTREASKIMIRARSGAIVNIASVVGLMGNAGQANYSASKGGLIALTKTTARELGGRGIRVNAVAPGFINSKMTEVLPDAVKQQMLAIIPLKKFGEVSDIAKTVAFLASDNASYVTGQVISVNGGMLMP